MHFTRAYRRGRISLYFALLMRGERGVRLIECVADRG